MKIAENNFHLPVHVVMTIFVIFTCYTDICLASHQDKNQNDSGVELKIGISNNTIANKDNLIIDCKILNKSKNQIKLFPILSINFILYYKDSGQNFTRIYPKISAGEYVNANDIITIEAGDIFAFNKTITRQYDVFPANIGTYQLCATYSNKSTNYNGIPLWVGELRSNEISFTIAP